MKFTYVLALVVALLAPSMIVTAADAADKAPAWAPGAERRFAKALDELKLKKTSRPGVYRVVDDGKHRFDHLREIAITRDGTLWVLRAKRANMVFRAGKSGGWSDKDGMLGASDVVSTPSGTAVLVKGQRLGFFEKGKWRWSTKWQGERAGPGALLTVLDDGTAWDAFREGLAHFDGSAWTEWSIDELGITFTLPFGEGWISGLGVTPDGSVWAGLTDRDARAAGLARFDGQAWSEVIPFEGDERIAVTGLDVGADGTLWAFLVPGHDQARAHLARWDGGSWSAWSTPSWLGDDVSVWRLRATPEGKALLQTGTGIYDGAGWTIFDGQTWTGIDIRHEVGSLDFAPDGTVWFERNVDRKNRLFMADLARIEPQLTEAAQAYVPTTASASSDG